ncbi:head GIN domain-containing protein [Hymenobacter sp. CRA2]|uniref:head GIN domain-containing protein n=1 Tax=Hymenobacter sp. CRA2 TaxID=1955620 RepID=UPI0015914C8F|nr:head GIN domain-containing protein [Hymenobacter sp. CRA2]
MKAQGSGVLVCREYPVSSFTRLHLSTRGTVVLVGGAEERIVVECDDNLLEHLQVVNSGRTLYVTSENKLRAPAFTELRVTVYLRQLDTLHCACQGDVVCENVLVMPAPLEVKILSQGNTRLRVQAPALSLNIACEGDVTLAGEAGEVQIKTAAAGNLDARELRAQHLRLRNASAGNLDLYAEQTINLTHLGAGHIHYRGPARLTDVRQYGAGEIRHVG